jgi:hypothetical protein
MKVTAPDPDAGTLRETRMRTVSQALVAPAPSPLTRLHPGHATELASFLVFADWAPEDLEAFGGDPEFTSEVQAAMRALQAAGGAR